MSRRCALGLSLGTAGIARGLGKTLVQHSEERNGSAGRIVAACASVVLFARGFASLLLRGCE